MKNSSAAPGKKIIKTLFSVSGIVILAKLMGFVKQMITADAFGANRGTDLISLSEGFISNLDYMLVHTLITAFVPVYLSIKKDDKSKSNTFFTNTVLLFSAFVIAVSAVIMLIAPFISRILAPSYDPDTSAKLTGYLRIFAPSIVIIITVAILNALLKANEVFVPGELTSVNHSLIYIILILLLGPVYGVNTLVISFYAYIIFNFFFLLSFAGKYVKWQPGRVFGDPDVKKLLQMMAPLLLGYAMVYINQQVDNILVSGMGSGVVTSMHYSAVLSNLIGTFVASVCSVVFTYVSKYIIEKKQDEASNFILLVSEMMTTILVPVSVLTILNSTDIISVVYMRGAFAGDAVRNSALALTGYGIMFVPLVFRELFSRFQYGYMDTKRPMINSCISITINIILSIAMSRPFGVIGVTAATSISVMVCAVLNMVSSRRYSSSLSFRPLFRMLPYWAAGIAWCAFCSIFGQRILNGNHHLVRFVLITAVSLLGYILMTLPITLPAVRKYKALRKSK